MFRQSAKLTTNNHKIFQLFSMKRFSQNSLVCISVFVFLHTSVYTNRKKPQLKPQQRIIPSKIHTNYGFTWHKFCIFDPTKHSRFPRFVHPTQFRSIPENNRKPSIKLLDKRETSLNTIHRTNDKVT